MSIFFGEDSCLQHHKYFEHVDFLASEVFVEVFVNNEYSHSIHASHFHLKNSGEEEL
jgi:hypothetical protein